MCVGPRQACVVNLIWAGIGVVAMWTGASLFGATGLAVASTATIAGLNITQVVLVWRQTGIMTLPTLRPGPAIRSLRGERDALQRRVEARRSRGSRSAADRVTCSMKLIAIDGPAGSGKSTVARRLADRLGLEYLDTGAMYRGVAFAALRRGIDPADADDVGRLAEDLELEVGDERVAVDGVDATIEIRGPEVTRAVSIVAANPRVRAELRRRQREWATERGGGVMEGRDIGTVVFPDATLKVYLTATPEVRASRRSKEVSDLDYETVAADLARRDALDEGRADSPLAQADDATIIDTSDLSIDEIVDVLQRRVS